MPTILNFSFVPQDQNWAQDGFMMAYAQIQIGLYQICTQYYERNVNTFLKNLTLIFYFFFGGVLIIIEKFFEYLGLDGPHPCGRGTLMGIFWGNGGGMLIQKQ